ncbi:uncharacterized protein LOC131649978 [Vicia villosa]|uniref:uncharacterized protein LOC131649978 n=1 Tax=Vicia villosa TaxID=3911 RepID=UPI00273C182A|nr:uncharacterized protein LOC131649978 [Vicia villosa]
MVGRKGEAMDEESESSQVGVGESEAEWGEIRVEEELIGGYECPNFIFSEKEEKRIQRPWKRGVIVKLLGKRIGYKALENRLNQMLVHKGIIGIIDLSNDYYLLRPNFQPEIDTINEVAVWVRISSLPVEYYDTRALFVFGYRIGHTVKVDKRTIKQERGKYVRICVTINLAKPLLAMLRIQGSIYKIEYEGLPLLCLVCERYGNYKENCPTIIREKHAVGESSNTGGEA